MAASLDLSVVRFTGSNLDRMEERLDVLHNQWTLATDTYNAAIAVPINETLPVAACNGAAAAEAEQLWTELSRFRKDAYSLGQPSGSTLPEAFMRQKMDLAWSYRERKMAELQHAEEVRRLQLENTMLKAERLVHKSSHV